MSDTAKFQANFSTPPSEQYAKGDMVNIYADTAEEFTNNLQRFVNEHAGLVAQAGSLYRAAVAAGDGLGAVPVAPTAPPVQQQPQWQSSPPQTQPQWSQPAQQAAPQQQGSRPGAQTHPEGKACDVCSTVLEYKTTQGGKAKWQCPQWRWNNGNPNGHSMEWVN